jgi:threonine dehydrogenase-like Zn-dependent dehydrogenase
VSVALEMFRSMPRYIAARSVGRKLPGVLTGAASTLRLVEAPPLDRPREGWVRIAPRIAGICGSDLSAIAGRTSLYFSALVSMPFVPGHEVVGELLDDAEGFRAGDRVVIDPVLSCRARGITPPCTPCDEGRHQLCERVTAGHVSAGLQTGYCADTGGGWSEVFLAHVTQLVSVPDHLHDRAAVMVEPAACAIRAVRRARVADNAGVVIVGAGTVGLLTLAALRRSGAPGSVIVVAKHRHQADLARLFGADEVVQSDDAIAAVRRETQAFKLHPIGSKPFLLGGADVAFECAGSPDALDVALRCTKGEGRVVLASMPASADLSPVWFRELEVVGSYTGAGAFSEAIEFCAETSVQDLVSATYPLTRWREAIEHALSSGRLGAVKVAFDIHTDGRRSVS